MKCKNAILFLLFLPVPVFVCGQQPRLDSLKLEVDKSKSERVSKLVEVAKNYVDSVLYNDYVVSCLEEALDSAIRVENDSLQVEVYNYLGLAEFNVGAYEKGTNYFYKALNLLDHNPNLKQKAKVYNNLGMVFDELEDFSRALEFYKESFRLDSLAANAEGLLASYINLGICYQNLKQYQKAWEFNNKAYQLAETSGDSLSQVNVLNNMGTLAYDEKDYDESLDYYKEALDLYEKSRDQGGIAMAKNNIGLVYLDQKKYRRSLKNFKEALQIAQEIDLYDFSGDIYSNLSFYYEEQEDYKNALKYYDLYNEVYDSLIGGKQTEMIRKLEAQYRLEKKQREILELQQENMQQKELLNSSKNIQGYLYLIIGLVILFLAILFYLLREEKILARKLQEKTEELKKSNTSKDRFFSIIAHDLKNPFNALVSYTSLLRSEFDSFTKEELSQIITDLSDATEQGFALLENLLFWTRSQTNRIKVYKTFFNLKSVVDNVVSLATPNLVAKSQRVELDIDDSLQVFADKDMIATVVRNLIFNSIKFSYPDSVIRVNAKKIGENIQVSVIDQGIGIDAEKQHKFFNYEENTSSPGTAGETGSGLGLVICREFIEKNDGMVWLESEPGKGATFRFSIPHVEAEK
ncbi:ATP-binding protein [Sunxiuqinia elliptica]|uniref:histidine kinase n=1 Tax=Sunxiuqinia elliptica TaxID=655355 RepID=A0A1I2HHG3_9BACT|nr:tetratricopeptide repeat-containing sensor histidine kinase [Sunxiuqinia elliptica]SFF28327.1 Signal transduction histidine kinase [Sunxiuqinia elliptica]